MTLTPSTHISPVLKKGFTLIELLIVIGILAVLATVVVLVLNPSELFKQARDTQRMSDLATATRAINFYFITAGTPAIVNPGPYTSLAGATACGFTGAPCAATARQVFTPDGNGWIGVNLGSITPTPLDTLPRDPTNSGNLYYAFKGDSTNLVFELDARLESTKYKTQMTTDGGDANTCATYVETTCWYEAGTSKTL